MIQKHNGMSIITARENNDTWSYAILDRNNITINEVMGFKNKDQALLCAQSEIDLQLEMKGFDKSTPFTF